MASSIVPSPALAAGTNQSPTVFRDAITEFLKEKRKQPKFVQDYLAGSLVTAKDVQDTITQMESDSSHKKVRRIIDPVVAVMVDYSGILDTLCQADPMPTALIWGVLKAVVDCFRRYTGLYNTIKAQLRKLTDQLERLTEYEKLFGHSVAMQNLLKSSYVHILRFWSKVHEECNRPGPVVALRSITSFSTKKLDDILADITDDGDNIEKLVPIIRERVDKGEREDAADERQKAGIARDVLLDWVMEQQDEKKQRDRERKLARVKDMRDWLHGASTLNESRQKRGESVLRSDACGWLLDHTTFKAWFDQHSSQRTIWLNASPGMGKSVTCAFAVKHTKETLTNAATAYQYYSFDERVPALTVYRNIAVQLFDQLHSQTNDVPEHIHGHVQMRSDSVESIKELIKLIVVEMPQTYIFIDGLDEECDEKGKWTEASDVVDFFKNLTKDEEFSLRLWCSSQQRPCVRSKLTHFPTINMNEDDNSSDITAYIENMLPVLDSLDLDPGTKTLIFEDLKKQARGNFLWEDVRKGLPSDCERYYARKISSLASDQLGLVSKILSCIVYAKRPLLLDELCEAIGICNIEDGTNVSKREVLFKAKVLELCSPLVQIQDIEKGVVQSICILAHASVRSFLVKNPRILLEQKKEGMTRDLMITTDHLAKICLKYLSQPRYKEPLKKKRDTFETSAGEDIGEHHLLSYAAKYWDKHLDDVDYTKKWGHKVEQFVGLRQFITCMQVQSLFVEGQFQFWLNSRQMWMGPNLRRVFPHWFPKRHGCGESLCRQYYNFAGEWGYFLDEYTTSRGRFPGSIDRCMWGSLGHQNFLHNTVSRYKSFLFYKESDDQDFPRYFDCIANQGDKVQVAKLYRQKEDPTHVQVLCQRWCLRNGHRPSLKQTQVVKVPVKALAIYDHSLRTHVVGRPQLVSWTSNLEYLRVGSWLFRASENGEFAPLSGFEENNTYFEDTSSNGHYLAIAARRNISEKDLATTGLNDDAVEDFGKIYSNVLEALSSHASQSTRSSGGTPSTRERSSDNSSADSLSSANSSMTLPGIEDKVEDFLPGELENEPLELESDIELLSIESNSARESWSEGSTAARSDEIDDEDQWNDWGSEESNFDFEDMAEFSEIDSDNEQPELKLEETQEKIDIEQDDADSDDHKIDEEYECSERDGVGSDGESDNNSVLESNYTQSVDSDDEGSDEDYEGGAGVEILLQSNPRSTQGIPRHQRGKLRVYDTSSGKAVPVFRYEQVFPNVLFDSPPIFHHSAPLVVWPLGGGEILFADFLQNTYFTRSLRCSASRSCHVFIKGNFSPCGQYLHLVALEARAPTVVPSKEEGQQVRKPLLELTLLVSTHRLSSHRPSRSPPRLVFRTCVSLGASDTLSVSRLPYTLTWTPKELYLTKSCSILSVIRIPLFRTSTPTSSPPEEPRCQTSNQQIFLPNSANRRNVHYFPPQPSTEDADIATIVVGSRSCIPTQNLIIPKHEISPPMGAYVSQEKDLGGWRSMRDGDFGKVEEANRKRGRGGGGRLAGKFEKFDLNNDCDIVPYLF